MTNSVLFRLPLVAMVSLLPMSAEAVDKVRAGWLERVRIEPEGFEIDSKLDTGADNSSIGARDIVEFRRDGVAWVRFTVERAEDGVQVLERQVVKTIRVKRHGAQSIRRFVVNLDLCLARQRHTAQVSLADRSQFDLPMLIGRSFLAGRILVDSAEKYIATSDCAPEKAE